MFCCCTFWPIVSNVFVFLYCENIIFYFFMKDILAGKISTSNFGSFSVLLFSKNWILLCICLFLLDVARHMIYHKISLWIWHINKNNDVRKLPFFIDSIFYLWRSLFPFLIDYVYFLFRNTFLFFCFGRKVQHWIFFCLICHHLNHLSWL